MASTGNLEALPIRSCHANLIVPEAMSETRISRFGTFENTKTEFAVGFSFDFLARMASWSERLRERAKELGLTNIDVARRVGLAQNRYSRYVNGDREPDLALFARICAALRTTPDAVLGFAEHPPVERPAVQDLLLAAEGMSDEGLVLATEVVRTVAAHLRRQEDKPTG